MMFRHVMQRTLSRLLVTNCWGRLSFSNNGLRGVIVLQNASKEVNCPRNLLNSEHISTSQITQRRCFWGVSVAFNQVDPERVRLAGPDRAAAEWILRNGGSVKWKDSPRKIEDYNLLPSTEFDKYKLEDIDLTATDVIGLGFQHLENLQFVKSVKLHGCRMIMNDALEHLHFVKDTLQELEISRCPMITEKGLEHLHVLKKLKKLVIYDLIEMKNFDDSISRLRQAMPWCEMNCDDPLSINPEDDK